MQILFVPFLTDTQNGYNRVRLCAQARAIENECYVGHCRRGGQPAARQQHGHQLRPVGHLYPFGFCFPHQRRAGGTTPNTEMTVIADVSLELLKELHEFGSVNTRVEDRLVL